PGDSAEPLLTTAKPGFRADYKGSEEKLPVPVAPQPVAFSHKVHAAAGAKCANCHTTATRQERAGIPNIARCALCHQDMRNKPAIDWVRVYKLRDFVFFSHAKHVNANVACADCHGPVETRDVLAKEKSTSMVACVDCHRARNAPVTCNVCHELGQ